MLVHKNYLKYHCLINTRIALNIFQKQQNIEPIMKKNLFILISIFTTLLIACSTPPKLSGYKMDIQQGNDVEEDSISQIKQGMSRTQVQNILGTPLMQDDFHANRWDYVFYLKEAGKKPVLKSVAIIFNGDSVSQILK